MIKSFVTTILTLGFLGLTSANAAIIDIIDNGNGLFDITSDGTPVGNGMSRSAAEKMASKYSSSGNTVNWKSRVNPTNSALSGGSQPKALPAAKTSVPKAVNAGGAALGVVGMATGAYGLYDSVEAKDTKTTWGDVAQGAASGATFTGSAAAFVNAIPVGGQIAYGGAIAVGTIIGAVGAGAKMFSQTDCNMDPVTGQYACCNVSKLTDMPNARYCNIGDEMFGQFPYVHTCMQGKNKFESNWIKARFLDDHWSKTGEVKFCSGYEMPADGDYKIQVYGSSQAKGKVCWAWKCADEGYVRQGNKCVEQKPVVQKVVGEPCSASDLKLIHFATKGVYVKIGNEIKCAATACQTGTYLVVNNKNMSQGWCVAPSYCTEKGTTLKIINNTTTNLECIKKDGSNNNGGGSGSATPAPNGSQPFNCSSSVLQELAQYKIKYRNSAEIVSAIDSLLEYCQRSDRNEAGYQIKYAELMALIASYDEAASVALITSKITEITHRIETASRGLKDIQSGLDKSRWKNEDGNFNTSRLVSDSVAGVVLGTAGGLITSKVVKKNQISNGFEDINCTIGGQVVAGWGDEFNVGVK